MGSTVHYQFQMDHRTLTTDTPPTPPPNTREHAIPKEPTTKMLPVVCSVTQLSMAINSVGPGAAFYREGAFHGAQCVSLNCPEWPQQSAGHRDLSARVL